MSQIQGEKVPLHKLFGDEFFFSLPDYQRPYSWTTTQHEQLISDLIEANKENEYFLGSIILQQVEKIGGGYKYEIIDGQQRITTLQILLAYLRDNIKKEEFKKPLQDKIYQPENLPDGIPEIIRLEIRERDFFRKIFQERGGTKEVPQETGLRESEKKMALALNAFDKYLKDMPQASLEGLVQFILQKCVVIYVATQNFDDAFKLFTILNDRGLQLRRIDILKAQNLDPHIILDNERRKEWAKKWEEMEEDLGADEFEELFFILRLIETKRKAEEDLLKEFDNQIFQKGKIIKGIPFFEYVSQYKNIYTGLFYDGKALHDRDKDRIAMNNLLGIMKENIRSKEWVAALLLYYKKYKDKGLFAFTKKLERKIFLDWVSGVTKDKRIINICGVLAVIEESKTPEEILSLDYFKVTFSDFEKFIMQKDFYFQDFSKYTLLLLEYLSSEQNVERKFGQLTIEHVLPQTPKNDSEWVETFSKEEMEKWTNSISNLVLLSKRKNSSASNLDFSDKKEKYFSGKMTDLPRSQRVLEEVQWNPEVLSKRKVMIEELFKKYS